MKTKLARIRHPVRRFLITIVTICLSLLNHIGWREHGKHNRRRRSRIASLFVLICYISLDPSGRAEWGIIYGHSMLVFIASYCILDVLLQDGLPK